MPAYGSRRPRKIDIVRIRIAREALDVLRISERVLLLGRRMTPHAIESESCIRIRKGRLVIVNTLSVPDLGPVPAVLRSLTVFDHDGPTVDSFRRLELVLRCGRRILLLDDHRSIRNRFARVAVQEPLDHLRRVINLDGRMNTVADAVNEWSGVAQFLVFTPIQSAILSP